MPDQPLTIDSLDLEIQAVFIEMLLTEIRQQDLLKPTFYSLRTSTVISRDLETSQIILYRVLHCFDIVRKATQVVQGLSWFTRNVGTHVPAKKVSWSFTGVGNMWELASYRHDARALPRKWS